MQFPAGLCGPVDVELARPVRTMPAELAMPGGSVYELKWEGFRVVVVHGMDGVRLWSRNGTDLTTRFPEVTAAAAQQVPVGTVVDGEVVIWSGGRLDFDLLQGRLATIPAHISALARRDPASYVAFDVLARDGCDLRGLSWARRRAALCELAAVGAPPLQLSPYTPKLAVARRWFTDYRSAGIEGLVIKGAGSRYMPGKRGWVTVKSRPPVGSSWPLCPGLRPRRTSGSSTS